MLGEGGDQGGEEVLCGVEGGQQVSPSGEIPQEEWGEADEGLQGEGQLIGSESTTGSLINSCNVD